MKKPEKMLTEKRKGYTDTELSCAYNQACTDYEYWLKQSASVENIEKISEKVHKAYCKEYKKQHGKDYWTKGDYSKLTEETKDFDRKIVKVLLKAIKEA